MARDDPYVPQCILDEIPNSQLSDYEQYAEARSKFNIFLVLLYAGLFAYICFYFLNLVRSPSLRKTKDRVTWFALIFFLFMDILSVISSSLLVASKFNHCFKWFQISYLCQTLLLLSAAGLLIISYNNACSQVYQYSINRTLITAQQEARRNRVSAAFVFVAICLLAICIISDSVRPQKLNTFMIRNTLTSWAQALFLAWYSFSCLTCYWLVRQSRAVLSSEQNLCGLNINRIMLALGIFFGVLCLLYIAVAYTDNLSAQLTLLCIQYLLFFTVKVLLFAAITIHTPGYSLKTNVIGATQVEIIGVNR